MSLTSFERMTACCCLLLGLTLVAGCSGSNHSAAVLNTGSGCILSSDCQEPLVCTAGRCHAQCAQSRDCDFGQRCVKIVDDNVCQLQVEAKCAYNSDCTSPLVCAVDRQCRSQCQADRDCTKGQICTPVTRVCAEPSEVTTDKELIPTASIVYDLDGGTGSSSLDTGVTSPAVDAPVGANAPDVPVVTGPANDFTNAWKPVMVADAGVVVLGAVDALDAGGITVLAIPGQAPLASPVAVDPPRILVLDGRIADSLLQLSITYQSNNTIAATVVAPSQASYFTRVVSSQPKTPSHPAQFSLNLALPANLSQLAAEGLALPVMIALEDTAGHVSRYVALNLSFQRLEAGAGLLSSASTGKVCTWDQPATCLPDGTGMLVCAVDEMTVKVVDCPIGPPAYRCVGGGDGGVATCECPNSCAAEGRTCGKDSCGHDCGTCPAGSECDPLGNCRPRSKSGCADGTREAFNGSPIVPVGVAA